MYMYIDYIAYIFKVYWNRETDDRRSLNFHADKRRIPDILHV